jgi:hypothetical protein
MLRMFLSFDADRFFDPLPGYSGEALQPIIAALISIIVLAASGYIILSGSFDGGQKWAVGAVGLVIGYWLRAPGSAPLRFRAE